ncbi:hypothetical protein LTR53_001267 [Teratosphaeriaceae sp. CCFEE 6253]|nr:hypothetical protein LTR53_001267 [Teratosphaeriaceae sp. CCFEE 6253]
MSGRPTPAPRAAGSLSGMGSSQGRRMSGIRTPSQVGSVGQQTRRPVTPNRALATSTSTNPASSRFPGLESTGTRARDTRPPESRSATSQYDVPQQTRRADGTFSSGRGSGQSQRPSRDRSASRDRFNWASQNTPSDIHPALRPALGQAGSSNWADEARGRRSNRDSPTLPAGQGLPQPQGRSESLLRTPRIGSALGSQGLGSHAAPSRQWIPPPLSLGPAALGSRGSRPSRQTHSAGAFGADPPDSARSGRGISVEPDPMPWPEEERGFEPHPLHDVNDWETEPYQPDGTALLHLRAARADPLPVVPATPRAAPLRPFSTRPGPMEPRNPQSSTSGMRHVRDARRGEYLEPYPPIQPSGARAQVRRGHGELPGDPRTNETLQEWASRMISQYPGTDAPQRQALWNVAVQSWQYIQHWSLDQGTMAFAEEFIAGFDEDWDLDDMDLDDQSQAGQ